jgi:hypothetical protein
MFTEITSSFSTLTNHTKCVKGRAIYEPSAFPTGNKKRDIVVNLLRHIFAISSAILLEIEAQFCYKST